MIVYAGISWCGKTPLVMVDGSVNAVEYTAMLDYVCQPFVEELYQHVSILQRDRVPEHTARHTQEYFLEEGMTVMPWPARSPDMKCIDIASV